MTSTHHPAPTPPLLQRVRTRQVTSTEVAGSIAALLLGAFAGLQLANALGSPLARHFWGGRTELPLSPELRVASVLAWAVLLMMLRTVTNTAGLTTSRLLGPRQLRVATWTIAAYMTVNTIGNALSTSDLERFVFTPLTAVIAGCAVIVARRGTPTDHP